MKVVEILVSMYLLQVAEMLMPVKLADLGSAVLGAYSLSDLAQVR
jgi:hypothetical protein